VTDAGFWDLWYFHIPNYLLAALMYSMLGRLILSFFFPPDSRNYIFLAFVRLTDPVIALVRPVTPLAVPYLLVLVFATLWLLVLRFVLLALLVSAVAPA
jgi:YggT family protein